MARTDGFGNGFRMRLDFIKDRFRQLQRARALPGINPRPGPQPMVFFLFPEVQTVKTAFIWLVHNHITVDEYHRERLPAIWSTVEPRLIAVQDAVDLGVYKATASGLCRYCPAKSVCTSARR